jgi:hypothetical protein
MKNKLKITILTLLLGSLFSATSATLSTGDTILGSFTTGNFFIDPGSLTTTTQSSNGVAVSGTLGAGDNWYGDFLNGDPNATPAPSLTINKDWSSAFTATTVGGTTSYTSSVLQLVIGASGSITGSTAAPLPITVTLFDSTFATIEEYSAVIPTSVAAMDFVKLISKTVGTGNAQDVYAFQVGWGSTQAGVNNLTFAYVIPEPSAISLVGLGLMGLAAMRIRRKS